MSASFRGGYLASIVSLVISGLTTQALSAEAATTSPAEATARSLPPSPAGPSVSPDARELLDAIDSAYKNLKSLNLVGTLSQDVRISGRTRQGTASFTSSFLSPNFFRHEVKGNLLCGSTGSQAFSYNERMRLYVLGDAPAGRTSIDKLPAPIEKFIDPSLMLVLGDVPSEALRRDAAAISRGSDAMIDGIGFPKLILKQKNGAVLTLLLDSQTHLLHRALLDARGELEANGNAGVETALLTTDYSTVTPDAPLRSDQFAWSAPEDARDASAKPAAGAEPESATALEGKEAPDFKLAGMDDKQVSRADVKGSVTILDFWATWCPPCRASLPHLAEIYAKFKGDGLKVYAVNVSEEKQAVQAFIDETKLAVPVLLDSDGAAAQKYQANAIPETVLIGKDGKIRKVFIGFGPDTEEQLAAAIKSALAE